MALSGEAPNVIKEGFTLFCRQLFRSQRLPGRTYVPCKWLVKISLRSSQALIIFLGRWSSRCWLAGGRGRRGVTASTRAAC
jgi:hypothetical protein